MAYASSRWLRAKVRGSSGGIYPVHPDKSVLLFRMESMEPSIMMPELGRSSVHAEGMDVLQRWIASLNGDC
jgi:hypothetical protein